MSESGKEGKTGQRGRRGTEYNQKRKMIRKLVFQDIQYINIFEKVTHVRPSDCFAYGIFLVFVVQEDQLSRAIGQHGVNAKRLSALLNRRIKIISYNGNKAEFIHSIISPIKVKELRVDESVVSIRAGPQSKALIIGKNSLRLKELKGILERYFKVDMIRVM